MYYLSLPNRCTSDYQLLIWTEHTVSAVEREEYNRDFYATFLLHTCRTRMLEENCSGGICLRGIVYNIMSCAVMVRVWRSVWVDCYFAGVRSIPYVNFKGNLSL